MSPTATAAARTVDLVGDRAWFDSLFAELWSDGFVPDACDATRWTWPEGVVEFATPDVWVDAVARPGTDREARASFAFVEDAAAWIRHQLTA